MSRNAASIVVCFNRAMILRFDLRICQVFTVIAYRQYKLACHESFFHEIEDQIVNHFPGNYLRLLAGIRTVQDLTRTKAFRCRPICLDVLHGTGFPAPGMVYQLNALALVGSGSPAACHKYITVDARVQAVSP